MLPDAVANLLRLVGPRSRIAVLTGAGISAESGIKTFRDARDALWSEFSNEQLASPAGWRADPARVWAWYEWRRAQVMQAQPNPGHRALAELGRLLTTTLITQNVDDLHERADSNNVLHLHGSLFAPRCFACARPGALPDAVSADMPPAALEPPRCAHCGGRLRPGVVWFGESLEAQHVLRAITAVTEAHLVLVVGTSGLVRPAADLPFDALEAGVPVVEINPQPALEGNGPLCAVWRASAGEALPSLVQALSRQLSAG